MSEQQLASVVEGIYEAALEPRTWSGALDEMTRLVGADFAQFMLWDDRAQTTAFSEVSHSLPKSAEAAYCEHYGALDPRLGPLAANGDGEWVLCHQHFDERYVSVSEFYQDFLIPVGGRYLAAGRFGRAYGLAPILGLHRGRDRQPFGAEELVWLDRLRPHLQRASRMQLELTRSRLSSALGELALQALEYAVIIADGTGRILFANYAADVWLADNGVLCRRENRLTSPQPGVAERLDRLLRTVAGGAHVLRTGGALRILRPGLAQPDQLLALPLRPEGPLAAAWQRPLALLIVARAGTPLSLTPDHLQALFGLTPAESRLAVALADGQSLEDYAQGVRVSLHTARSCLKQVMEKTGTHRQAELVKVLLSLPKTAAGSLDPHQR